MIDRKLIVANAPSNMGEQFHVNHVGCPAGEDTKKRLYIKKTAGGLLAYCHHCSEHGFIKDKSVDGDRLASWLRGKRVDVPEISVDKPGFAGAPLSVQGKRWLWTYNCDDTDTVFGGVHDHPNQVTLQLRNPDGKLIGWQVRNLNPLTKPKYLTQFMSGIERGDASWFIGDKNTLVITEDYLSAYRVNKATALTSVALLKTSISDKTLQQISLIKPSFIYIWLDPDAAGIKGTHEAMDKLKFFLTDDTTLVAVGVDMEPKECSSETLKETLL